MTGTYTLQAIPPFPAVTIRVAVVKYLTNNRVILEELETKFYIDTPVSSFEPDVIDSVEFQTKLLV